MNSGARPSGGGRASLVDWRRCWRWRSARVPWPPARRSTSRRRSTSSRRAVGGRRLGRQRDHRLGQRRRTSRAHRTSCSTAWSRRAARRARTRAASPPPTRPATSTACGCSTTPERWCILADVFGAAGNNAGDYTPEQEWQSTDDGASWTLQNSGLSVTSGIIDADTEPVDAVILPGTGALGYGWDTAEGAPTFNAFPLDRSARVLGGDVPSRLRDARARHQPRSARQRAGALRVDLHRPAGGRDGRVRQPGHQRPAGVRPELRRPPSSTAPAPSRPPTTTTSHRASPTARGGSR